LSRPSAIHRALISPWLRLLHVARMYDRLPHDLLAALRYEDADPATLAEVAYTHAVPRLQELCSELADKQHGPVVIPLRAGGRR
jgi:hypothetical protein